MDVPPTIQHLHGRIRSITGDDPAVGAEILEIVPARRRWRLSTIIFSLTTNPTAADRTVTLIIDDGTNALTAIISTTVQTASQTRQYIYKIQPVPQFTVGNDFNIPFPVLPLSANFRIRTATTNHQTGDYFTAPRFLVEEWIDP